MFQLSVIILIQKKKAKSLIIQNTGNKIFFKKYSIRVEIITKPVITTMLIFTFG